ncbi:hypothetical protein J4E85_010580 [Alternaria conjuncta]|uniref:uncharacterized protein n=1 Tax=Alternaria conjuncta TaxID=181017 RepID=UPI00221F4E7D|nr:uncharacterized protein J4E85_010580 [Alternaria conjuncta]KAI4607074.1 hypothetical protein J4E80_009804 [Alternaria sp. BMP 0032]KAI4914515.1 hypothetical protein J4E85_010580 [Alternaria conjuncta]
MDTEMTSPAPTADFETNLLDHFTSKSRRDDNHTYATSIHIKSKAQATAFARTTSTQPPDRTLVLWINSSVSGDLRNEPCAVAIGYNSPVTSAWTAQVTIAHYTNANEAILLSIGEALRIAATPSITEHIDRILVFSDVQRVLKSMRMGHPFGLVRDRWLVDDIPHLTKQLAEKSVEVEFHWLPPLSRIEPHQRIRHTSQRFKKLALAEYPAELLDRSVSFPPVRLDAELVTGGAGEDFVGGWLSAAFKDVKVLPRRELSRDLRVQARQAINQRRKERKEKAKARRIKDKAEREIRKMEKEMKKEMRKLVRKNEMKVEEQEVLGLEDDSEMEIEEQEVLGLAYDSEMKVEEQEVLSLADDSVATTYEHLDNFGEQERPCMLVEKFENMDLV